MSGFKWEFDFDWQPASNLLAVLTELENGRYAIWTVRPDGSQQRKVIEENELESPRWSPAGDGIYFLRFSRGNTKDLLKVTINTKSGQAKDPASVLLADNVDPPEPSTSLSTHAHGFYWTEGIRGLGWARG